MVEYPYLPTVGKNTAAMAVDTAWFSKSAMLIPLERIRVGINSESASQTQTPGPIAKNAMKTNSVIATIKPLVADGTGVIRAFRSEEHTSELQSLRHLVCRLLLEKK